MEEQSIKGPMAVRLWLTGVFFCQVFLTPAAAFSITYLIKFNIADENLSLSYDKEMIPWIGTASLVYGLLAIFLALILGGYTPLFVVERGGWKNALGLSRNPRSAASRRVSRISYSQSPHGRLTVLAHDRYMRGSNFLSTHGGLIILAVPFQVMLATIPLAVVLWIPDGVLRSNRRLELALLLYLVGLMFTLRYLPVVAERFINLASTTRKWLLSMTRLSFLAPVLVLWLMGRIASIVVLGWLGTDASLSIHLEQEIFESILNVNSIPETSFLDLLTALAVMPISAFTTLAVLGGSTGTPPQWMRRGKEAPTISTEEEEYRPAILDSMAVKGAGIVAASAATVAMAAATGAATKAQSAAQGLNAMASATPGMAMTASQSLDAGMGAVTASEGALSALNSGAQISDVAGVASEGVSSFSDGMMDFDLIDDVDNAISGLDAVSELGDSQSNSTKPSNQEPAITGL